MKLNMFKCEDAQNNMTLALTGPLLLEDENVQILLPEETPQLSLTKHHFKIFFLSVGAI